jgi:hypothetical protein
MEKKEKFDDITDQFMQTDLCNSMIKSTFVTYLLALNHEELDLENLFSINENACQFEIKSKQSNHLKINVDFWKYQVNIYLGEGQLHYADDAEVKNNKEQIIFKKELDILFYSSVIETTILKKYKLVFKDSDNIVKESKSQPRKDFSVKNILETFYTPWLQKNVK